MYPKQEAALFSGKRFTLVEATSKAGKAQPLDSKIYTPAGPKLMGDLKVGDFVFGANGKATKIVAIHPQGLREIYAITFVDGTIVECDKEHLWEVHNNQGKPRIRAVSELLDLKSSWLRYQYVPDCAPVEFEIKSIDIDPYLLGILIGDGNFTTEVVRVSSADFEILEEIKKVLPAGHFLRHVDQYDYHITCGKFAAKIREAKQHIASYLKNLKLWGCYSHQKFIPISYLYNSTEIRISILQGIMDSDGSVNKHGQPILEQSSEQLAKDVKELVESLGGMVKQTYDESASYCSPIGTLRHGRGRYRQVLILPSNLIPFRLPRKLQLMKPMKKTGNRFFNKIEFSRIAEAQCIEVEDTRHLYLTNGFVPTHNTVGSIVWITEMALLGPTNRNYWWVAPISDQADIAFRRLKTYLTPGSYMTNEQRKTITLMNGAVLWFKSGDNPDSLFGEDVYGAVIDEASRVKELSWHAVRSTLSATQGAAIIIGNVKGKRNWFYNMARLAESTMDEEDSDLHYAKLTIFDAIEGGVMSDSEVKSLKEQLPDAVFRELYLAEPSDDYGNPFGEDHILRCVANLSSESPVAWGVDLARKKTWFVIIGLDRDGYVCHFDRWKNKSWKESVKLVREIVGDLTPCVVDGSGLGDPVLESLQEGGYENFEGYILNPSSKQNLMEGLAMSVQTHEVHFPDGPIKSEMQDFTYEITRAGIKYTAPEGLYDDCVCSLAFARYKWNEIKASFTKSSYASRGVIGRCVVEGRLELPPSNNIVYSAFFAVPGSTSERPAFAIAHMAEDNVAMLDFVKDYSIQESLEKTIADICSIMRSYGIAKIEGDHFGGNWPKEYFSVHGIIYSPTSLTLPEIYRDFMPILAAGEVELLENAKMLNQMGDLERSITKAGRDSVFSSGSDYLARCVAGLIVTSCRGTWATWQKLARKAKIDKEQQLAIQTARYESWKERVEVAKVVHLMNEIRIRRGREQPKADEEILFLSSPSKITFPCDLEERVLKPGTWIVPKGTRALNKHI